MARIRYLKPDFFKDEDLAEFPFETRLFFAGLWNFADKAGRLEDRPIRLKAEIFPYDNVDTVKCLDLLSKVKNGSGRPFIQRYEIEGQKYIQIVNWDKHQKPHHTETESKIPPIPPLKIKRKEKGTIKGMESVEQATTELSNGYLTVKTIIEDLNLVLATSYKPTTKATKEFITARLNEGFTVDDFKTVHRNMAQTWGADSKMAKFLRPSTLYSPKFESYLNIKNPTLKVSEKTIKSMQAASNWANKGETIDVKQI